MNNLSELSLLILGSTQITLDGRPLSFRTNKVQALLCYLAVEAINQPGVGFRRESLMTLLWPDMPLKSAQDNLRQTLYQLRKAIPKTFIFSDRLTIQMNPAAAFELDVAEFQRLLATGSELANLEKAAVLYRGDFLSDFYLPDSSNFENWAAKWRHDLRMKALTALDALTNAFSEQNQFEWAESYARRQLEIDDLRESAHRQLMMALVENGRRSDALQQYNICRQLLLDELGVEPSTETDTLYEQIRSGERGKSAIGLQTTLRKLTQAKAQRSQREPFMGVESQSIKSDKEAARIRRRHNLPAATTSFIGRQQELAEVISRLSEPNCRLLTLLGPGGIGKTRLSLQVASTLAQSSSAIFQDGVFLVSLAAVSRMDYLVPAIAEAVGFSFSGSKEPRSQLLNYLKSKEMLLVLDNLEHLVGEAGLLAELLTAVPGLTILTTSRIRLNLYEEWPFELKGLAVPNTSETSSIEDYSAIQLFIERAKQFGLQVSTEKELALIGQICQLLAGLSLGIELAAGWVRSHTLEQIAAEIERDLDFLSTTIQNVPERHRSLQVAFDHSWRLLSADSQQILSGLTVFRGGFEQEAADFVAGASRTALANLVDNSMLFVVNGRFQMNELLRQFGAEKLTKDAGRECYQRHAGYYAQFLMEREQQRWTAEEPAVLTQIGLELKNILAGWQWVISHLADPIKRGECLSLGSQYITMLAYFYEQRNRFHEGVRLFQMAQKALLAVEEGINNGEAHAFMLAQTLAAQADLRFHLGQFSEVEKLLEESLATFRKQGSKKETAATLVRLGMTYNRLGKFAKANRYLEESLSLLRQMDAWVASAEALNGLGIVAISEGRFEKAQSILSECLTVYEKTAYQRGIARALSNLGTANVRSGNYSPAIPQYESALEAARRINDAMVTAIVLSNLGSIANTLGKHEDGLRYYEESLAIFQEMGERRWIAVNLNGLGETLLDMGQVETAETHLREALEISTAIQSLPDSLDSLAALGQISAVLGNRETAVVILSHVEHDSMTKPQARARAKRTLSQLKEALPRAVWQEARISGINSKFVNVIRYLE